MHANNGKEENAFEERQWIDWKLVSLLPNNKNLIKYDKRSKRRNVSFGNTKFNNRVSFTQDKIKLFSALPSERGYHSRV